MLYLSSNFCWPIWQKVVPDSKEAKEENPLDQHNVYFAEAHPNPTSNWSAKLLEVLHIPNLMHQDVPNVPLDYYTCQFKKSKLQRFLGSDDQENFFEDTQRHRILGEILSTTVYGKKKRAEIGIERLIDEHGFVAAFPLHSGNYEIPDASIEPELLNKRQVLHKYWARWGCWYKYQPLDHIREYFGEKIGIYFAWLGFYTAWLLPASVVGVLVFLYGFITFHSNIPANDVCDSGKEFKMCPVCDEDIGCEYWYLSDVCLFVRISYLFDHPGTVFYAVFVSFWGVSFLLWYKQTNVSRHHQERPRPDYAARAPEIKENPITGINEPYFDPGQRLPRILSGIAAIIIMCSLLVLLCFFFLLFSSEMHRTQTEFEDQLTFKVFIFQFVNFYSSIIYVAFFKGKVIGKKLKGYWHRFKTRLVKGGQVSRWEDDYELIENEGLFQEYLEMVLQFGFITIFVAAFPLAPLFALLNNWVEIRLDAHKFVCETRRPVAERAQDIGVWFTILESLAQLAVISNAFLIAFTSEFLPRLLYQYEYEWDLHGYTNFTLAVSPNNTLDETCRYRDFRDENGDHTMFYWKLLAIRLAFVIVFEHVVFGICRVIDIMVPDVPETLELKIKREHFLAKQALADTDTIMMMARRNDEDDADANLAPDVTSNA
ncbi:anoctamin-7 [Aplysia californica]|uniref:Anoctamin n=1 Tax=Aplysia californica TaxID=6500 RepID=A0ABM1VTN3_APLCA|nr:anoctamin-7 [Aplysia californica]